MSHQCFVLNEKKVKCCRVHTRKEAVKQWKICLKIFCSCLIPDRLLGPRQQAPEGLGGEPRATGVCGLFCGSGRRLSENEDDGALKRLGIWAYREFCKIADSLFGNKENMVRNGDMPSGKH